MIRSYSIFIRDNFPLLLYGIILMILSSPGQTFFLSLFVEDFRAHFAITDGDIGSLFAIATVTSAFALPYLGQQIDKIALSIFTLAVGAFLSAACVLIGLAPASVIYFGICLFLLRLGGQGLMIHTARTASARAFPSDSGKAIAAVNLFYSAALIFIPSLMVALIGLLGWRASWILTAVIVIVGAIGAQLLLPRPMHQPSEKTTIERPTTAEPDPPKLWLMLIATPALLAVSFIFTGLLFHQALLAAEKGWSLEWLAACFSAFAVSQAATSFFAAPLIDKVRSVHVVPCFLLPLVAALLLIAGFDNRWVAPVYMGLLGVSAAVDLKLGTIVWSDLFGAERLGYVRSRFEAIRIIITGAAPLVVGKLFDLGVPLASQALGYAAYAICASALSLLLIKLPTRNLK